MQVLAAAAGESAAFLDRAPRHWVFWRSGRTGAGIRYPAHAKLRMLAIPRGELAGLERWVGMSFGRHPITGDLVSVIEAAYARVESEQDWLQGIADAALPCLDHGMGLNAYTYDAADPNGFRVPACAGAGSTVMDRASIEAIVRTGSPELIELAHEPGPPMYFSRLAEELTKRGVSDVPQTKERLSRHRLVDVLAVRGCDPSMRGCLITVHCSEPGRVSPSQHRVLACLGAHLASGWRLRQARAEVADADAVLDPKGRFLHLRDEEAHAERLQLDDAFRRRAHARGALRNLDAMAAMDLWRAMVRGEWTLVDHLDTDGKRFVLARRNSQTTPEVGALSKRECQVAAYAAYGFSIKEIGYELGLDASTVSDHLRTALRKLRIKTRGELAAILGR